MLAKENQQTGKHAGRHKERAQEQNSALGQRTEWKARLGKCVQREYLFLFW